MKCNNGIGYHNGAAMSEADPSAVFVRKVNISLALGNWQAFSNGFSEYGETRKEAISNAKNEANFANLEEEYLQEEADLEMVGSWE